MKKILLLSLLLAVPSLACAKEKMLPLSEADATRLTGKTLVVTRHAKPSFAAMTAGKASFGLFGAAAMVSAGNALVRDNDIADPADVIEAQLAPALAKAYGLALVPTAQRMQASDKPKLIAASQADADFVLDIRTGGWGFFYYATEWGKYWVPYSAQVQLIDAKSGVLLANMACNGGTNKHPNPPTKDAMLAERAQLLKDITTGLAWTCTHLLAKEQFHLADDAIAATPAQYVDVLAAYAAAHGPGSAAAGSKVTATAAPVAPTTPTTPTSLDAPAEATPATPATPDAPAAAAPVGQEGGN